jgi:hypothetical protein
LLLNVWQVLPRVIVRDLEHFEEAGQETSDNTGVSFVQNDSRGLRFGLRSMMGVVAILATIFAISSQVDLGTGVFLAFGIVVGMLVAKLSQQFSFSYVLKLCLGMLVAVVCGLPLMIIVAVLNLPPIWVWMFETIMIWLLAAAVGGATGVLLAARKRIQ